jgi:pimeloyl-ACP methyl ester carboxylesterase
MSGHHASAGARDYTETWVRRGADRIYVRTTGPEGDSTSGEGGGPPLVLMHGFPDDLHLYDRLVPYLRPARQVVTFDFLGWGSSDKPAGYPYTATNQTGDLDAVIDQLGLERMVLVAHDASGPPAIDWALAHPERVAGLVLLNTYYQWAPGLRRPEAIFLYSTPVLRNLARFVVRRSPALDRRLYTWQVGRFIRDDDVRRELVPAFYQRFRGARPAFWRLNDDLLGTAFSRRRMVPRVRRFARPVRIVFGAADPYLNVRVARRFHELFPDSELFLLPTARHYVQVDEPAEVARLILELPNGS